MDLVPSLFDGVYIERDPGFNVASWNIIERNVALDRDGNFTVNSRPLLFYHFSKIESDGDGMTLRYAENNPLIFEIWNWYKRQLLKNYVPNLAENYWAFGSFADGTPISSEARLAYRRIAKDLAPDFNPFLAGSGSFLSWFREGARGDFPSYNQIKKSEVARCSDAERPAVAVALHAFYPDLIPEFTKELSKYSGKLKLFLSVEGRNVEYANNLLEGFSHPVEIAIVENRGRDMLPFLISLSAIIKQNFEFVLKVHTKRSTHRRDGDKWRRELISALADPAELSWTIEQLLARPDVGIVGPSRHVLALSEFWGSNESLVMQLAKTMGVETLVLSPPAFVAGSMFIARTNALIGLHQLSSEDKIFEVENGQIDGTFAHALERAITYSAAKRALRVATKPNNAASNTVKLGVPNLSIEMRSVYEFARD